MSKKSVVIVYDKEELSSCCGVNVIGEFENRLGVEDSQMSIRNTLDDCGNLTLATTVPYQREAIKALQENGFKRMARFKSAGTGNVITLWGKAQSKNRGAGYRPRIGEI